MSQPQYVEGGNVACYLEGLLFGCRARFLVFGLGCCCRYLSSGFGGFLKLVLNRNGSDDQSFNEGSSGGHGIEMSRIPTDTLTSTDEGSRKWSARDETCVCELLAFGFVDL